MSWVGDRNAVVSYNLVCFSQKLRRILRKCINISEKEFKHENLLHSTIPVVTEILGETFTELSSQLPSILEIVKYEQELFRSLRASMSKDVNEIMKQNPNLAELDVYDYPGFVPGYQEFKQYKKTKSDVLSGEFMYQIHSTFGFDMDLMERLAELEGMTLDKLGFDSKMNQLKKAFKEQNMNAEMMTAIDGLLQSTTNNDPKYEYTFDGVHQVYKVEPLKTKVLSIVGQNGIVSSTDKVRNSSIKVIVEKSPFYYESGGQESDAGCIMKGGKKFKLKSVSSRKNCLLHEVDLPPQESLAVGDEVHLLVDQEKRTAVTRNHSATHLLNSALRKITNSPIYQKSSLVTSEQLKIEVACFGPKLNHQDVSKFENFIRSHIIEQPLERKIRVLNSQDLQNESDVVMVPGEIYPDEGIRLVTFGDLSKELCCGTHVFNTKELQEFTFLSMRATGRSSYLFTATTGPVAVEALSTGDKLAKKLRLIGGNITAENFRDVLSSLREVQIKLNNSNLPISFLKKLECQELTDMIKEKVKHESRNILSELLDIEMKSVLDERKNQSFIVHFLSCSDLMKSVPLQKATRYVKDRPVLVISLTDGSLKARCVVPLSIANETFNAETWLGEVAKVFKAQTSPPKGQNPKEMCNMKEKRVDAEKFDKLLQDAIAAADEFAKNKK